MHRDHPRMCGEKGLFCRPPAHVMGSPPHVRGKEAGQAQASEHSRITPACAGKRKITLSQLLASRDHPRMCGEKCTACMPLPAYKGSPPHVRGKGAQDPPEAGNAGITPACAGKRFGLNYVKNFLGDHPRMCGEKSVSLKTTRWSLGSPPHMRGKENM